MPVKKPSPRPETEYTYTNKFSEKEIRFNPKPDEMCRHIRGQAQRGSRWRCHGVDVSGLRVVRNARSAERDVCFVAVSCARKTQLRTHITSKVRLK